MNVYEMRCEVTKATGTVDMDKIQLNCEYWVSQWMRERVHFVCCFQISEKILATILVLGSDPNLSLPFALKLLYKWKDFKPQLLTKLGLSNNFWNLPLLHILFIWMIYKHKPVVDSEPTFLD